MLELEVVVRVEERLHKRQSARRRRPSAGLNARGSGAVDLTSHHVYGG
jgi:hypothetical protein